MRLIITFKPKNLKKIINLFGSSDNGESMRYDRQLNQPPISDGPLTYTLSSFLIVTVFSAIVAEIAPIAAIRRFGVTLFNPQRLLGRNGAR